MQPPIEITTFARKFEIFFLPRLQFSYEVLQKLQKFYIFSAQILLLLSFSPQSIIFLSAVLVSQFRINLQLKQAFFRPVWNFIDIIFLHIRCFSYILALDKLAPNEYRPNVIFFLKLRKTQSLHVFRKRSWNRRSYVLCIYGILKHSVRILRYQRIKVINDFVMSEGMYNNCECKTNADISRFNIWIFDRRPELLKRSNVMYGILRHAGSLRYRRITRISPYSRVQERRTFFVCRC